MRSLLSLLILGVALLFQSAVVSRINLLAGCADLVLLVVAAWCVQLNARHAWLWALAAGLLVGSMSQLPLLVPLAAYGLMAWLARLLTRRIWQAPLLGMFLVVFAGTLFLHSFTYITLWFQDTQLPLGESFLQIILPSTLLNLMLAAPVHALMRDLALWAHPLELET